MLKTLRPRKPCQEPKNTEWFKPAVFVHRFRRESPAGAIPARHLLPLEEIIAAALGQKPNTKKVNAEYDRLIERYGSELAILLDLEEEELAGYTPARVLAGIMKVRRGKVRITPGYDGVYGKIDLFDEEFPSPA